MPGYEVIGSEELAEIQDIFLNGGVLFRHGFDGLRNGCYKVRDFEKAFSRELRAKYSLAVTSGTAALRVALATLELSPDDEVITQCFTFVATVEAIIESGAVPICTEIDSTLNIDPEDFKKKITRKTKAVIVVHMLGMPCRLGQIAKICRENNIILIEDTAWGCGGNLNGIPLGTWGDIGTFSFDFAKTMTTGEGGMLVFKDESKWKRAVAWHDHGHENNPLVPRWEDTRISSGFNFRMMELQGALGLAQLKKLRGIVEAQRKNYQILWDMISSHPSIESRVAPEGSYATADALVFFVPSAELAIHCREELLNVGLSTKILPEAYTWHFAGYWSHMPELIKGQKEALSKAFPKSHLLLSRAVSIPVGVRMDEDMPIKVRVAINKALNG